MKIENEKQLNKFIEEWEELSEHVTKIAQAMLKLTEMDASIDDDEMYVDCGMLYVSYEKYVGGNDYNTHSLYIPHEYLFDDNFLEDAAEKLKIKKENDRFIKEKRKADAKEQVRQREMKEYLKLKKKFG